MYKVDSVFRIPYSGKGGALVRGGRRNQSQIWVYIYIYSYIPLGKKSKSRGGRNQNLTQLYTSLNVKEMRLLINIFIFFCLKRLKSLKRLLRSVISTDLFVFSPSPQKKK